MHGTILVGYLPVPKFDCFSEASRSLAKYRCFHSCMRIILRSLVKAGTDGTFMTCADRKVRKVWPILAAYVADHPEQCLVAGCMENRCSMGETGPNERGSHLPCIHRDQKEVQALLKAHKDGRLSPEQKARFDALGLRAIYEPFWSDLPHSDVFSFFTPDLLHQLHKGVFKDHLVKWCTNLLGELELDNRFRSTPTLHSLRHFKNGISGISQWTGHEHKEMEKVFLGLIAGGADEDVVRAVRALMDFIYLASLQSQTTVTLAALQQALDNFHACKNIFITLEARSPPHFNIPKYHMLEHYVELIRTFGSADGFNTEWSERLHIDYAKEAYRASNKKDYVVQMTRWLSRQEAVDRFTQYLRWCCSGEYRPPSSASEDPVSTPEPDDGAIVIQKSMPSSTSSKKTYKVAASHPVHLRNVPASSVIANNKASLFVVALQKFLTAHQSNVKVYHFDGFDLFKQLVTSLQSIPEVSDSKRQNIIRAMPPIPASGRKKATPGQFDFALVRTGERNEHTDSTALEGKPLHCSTKVALLTAYSYQAFA